MMTGSKRPPGVAAIGEVMVEFSPAPGAGDCYGLGFAGDTFNTAVGLARLGVPVTYATRLGDDVFSDRVVELMVAEGMDTRLVERVGGRQPGLYVIANTPGGERTFQYWRSESPARELWSLNHNADNLESQLAVFHCLYLSGITLAIMDPPARERLKSFLGRYRQGGGFVAFDSNYRARLWPAVDEARSTIGEFFAHSDLALLTLEDEQILWGSMPVPALLEHHHRLGLEEIVIKRGADSVYASTSTGDNAYELEVLPVVDVVDTTGAGDAFNAGYLATRLRKGSVVDALASGNRAASAVIRKPGGIVDRHWFIHQAAPPVD